jgi:AcrR family transcriptional regulator
LELKDHILIEADKLFCQFGIKSVTMDDIAKHLGMSKKTIYLHYKDKDELVYLLIKNRMETQVCIMDEGSSQASNALDEVFIAVTQMQSMLSNMNPMLFHDMQKYHPNAWVVFKTFKESNLNKVIRENLKRGIDEGYYRKELNLDIITKMRIEQIDMAFSYSSFPVNKYSVLQVMNELTEHYLYGICSLKGHRQVNKYKQINEE